MTDDYFEDFDAEYRANNWPGTTQAAPILQDPGGALDAYFNNLKSRPFTPTSTLGQYYQSLTSPGLGGGSPLRPGGAVGAFQPAGPPQRFSVNILGDAVGNLAGTGLGQAFLGTPGQQRGGTMHGIATAPVNFQNFATYAREGTLSLVTSALGHRYQQPNEPYAQPTGPYNPDNIFQNVAQLDLEGTLDNVIDGASALGDAINAPIVAFSNFMRLNAARSRAQGISDLMRTGSTFGDPVMRISSLWDQSRFDWGAIAAKAAEHGISTEEMAAELWDLSPAVVQAIRERPDMSPDQLDALIANEPFSYDPGINLIAELAVTLAPMLAGAWAVRTAGTALKGLGALGRLVQTGSLEGMGLLGKPIAAAERIGSWSMQKAWRVWSSKPVQAAGLVTGFTPKGLYVGAGIRFGEWALKQTASIAGNDEAMAMLDDWLWEMPLSNNPGLMLVDAFAVHPMRTAKAAKAGIGARLAGRADPLTTDPITTRRIGSIADMGIETIHERIGARLDWDLADMQRVWGPDSPTKMTDRDLKNGLLYVAEQVVRERNEARAKYIEPGAGIVERNEAFWNEYGAEATKLLQDELTGKGTAIVDALREEFWHRSNIVDASALGAEGGIGPYDGVIALQRFASWVRFNVLVRDLADGTTATLRPDINVDFLATFRTELRKRYKPNERVSARDLNLLQTYIPALATHESGLLRGRPTVPRITRKRLEALLDSAEAKQAEVDLTLMKPRTGKVPAIKPEEVESVKAKALAFKLGMGTIEELERGLVEGAEALGPVPGDLAKVISEVYSTTMAQIRRDPPGTWARALDWYGRMLESAVQRGAAQETLGRFRRFVDARFAGKEGGAADAEAIRRINDAISNPYSEAELKANDLLRAIAAERDLALSQFVDGVTAWLDSPLGKYRVTQLPDGARVILEADGFGRGDVAVIEALVKKAQAWGGELTSEQRAILNDPSLHPLAKVDTLRVAVDNGLPIAGAARTRLGELSDLETAYGPIFADVYGDTAPTIDSTTVATLTNDVANHADELVGLREQARGLAGMIDRAPSAQLSSELHTFYDEAMALGSMKVGAGKVEIPNWRSLPIEAAGVRTAVDDMTRASALQSLDGRIAERRAIVDHYDALAKRATTLVGKEVAAAEFDWKPDPVGKYPTRKAAREEAKAYQEAGIATRIDKVGTRWHLFQGEVRPIAPEPLPPAATLPEAAPPEAAPPVVEDLAVTPTPEAPVRPVEPRSAPETTETVRTAIAALPEAQRPRYLSTMGGSNIAEVVRWTPDGQPVFKEAYQNRQMSYGWQWPQWIGIPHWEPVSATYVRGSVKELWEGRGKMRKLVQDDADAFEAAHPEIALRGRSDPRYADGPTPEAAAEGAYQRTRSLIDQTFGGTWYKLQQAASSLRKQLERRADEIDDAEDPLGASLEIAQHEGALRAIEERMAGMEAPPTPSIEVFQTRLNEYITEGTRTLEPEIVDPLMAEVREATTALGIARNPPRKKGGKKAKTDEEEEYAAQLTEKETAARTAAEERLKAANIALDQALENVPIPRNPVRPSEIDPRLPESNDIYNYESREAQASIMRRMAKTPPEERPRFIVENIGGYYYPRRVESWAPDGTPLGPDGQPIDWVGKGYLDGPSWRPATLADLVGNGLSRDPGHTLSRELYLREALFGERPAGRAAEQQLARPPYNREQPGKLDVDDFTELVERAYGDVPIDPYALAASLKPKREAPTPVEPPQTELFDAEPPPPAVPPIVEQINEQQASQAAADDAFAAAEKERQAAFAEQADHYEQTRAVPVVSDVPVPPGEIAGRWRTAILEYQQLSTERGKLGGRPRATKNNSAAIKAWEDEATRQGIALSEKAKEIDRIGKEPGAVEQIVRDAVSARQGDLNEFVWHNTAALRDFLAPFGFKFVFDQKAKDAKLTMTGPDGRVTHGTAPGGAAWDAQQQALRAWLEPTAMTGEPTHVLGPDTYTSGPKGGDRVGDYRVRSVGTDGTLELAPVGPNWKRAAIAKKLPPGTALEYNAEGGVWHVLRSEASRRQTAEPGYRGSQQIKSWQQRADKLRAQIRGLEDTRDRSSKPRGKEIVAREDREREIAVLRGQVADLEARIAAKQGPPPPEPGLFDQGGQQQTFGEGEAAPVTPPVVPAPAEVTFLDPADNRTPIVSRVVLVDANDILTSDQIGFPANLQPRSRAIRASSDAQIAEYARDLQPDKLLGTTEGASGMPVVTPEGAVLAGNGRTSAIRMADPGVYARYKVRLQAEAPKYGFDVAAVNAMDRPMLVRELVGVDPVQQTRLAWQLNEMPMGDLAPSLASAITREDVRLLRIGDEQSLADALRSPENSGAVARIIDHLPADARARYFDPKTGINDLGATLVEGALLSKLLRADDRTLRTFEDARAVVFDAIEQGGEEMRRITNGLAEAAGQVLKAQERAEAGTISPEILSFSDDLTPALAKILALRQTGLNMAGVVTMLDNTTMFDEGTLTPIQSHIARVLASSGSQREIRAFLRGVARAADAGDEGVMPMFEEVRLDYTGVLNDGLRSWNAIRRELGKPEVDPFPSTEAPYDVPLTAGEPVGADGSSHPPVTRSQPLGADEVAGEVAARTVGERIHATGERIYELHVDENTESISLTDPNEQAFAEAYLADPESVKADVQDAISTAGRFTDMSALGDYYAGLIEEANAGTIRPGDWYVLTVLADNLVRRNKQGQLNMRMKFPPSIAGAYSNFESFVARKLDGRTLVRAEDAATVHQPHPQKALSREELAEDVGPDVAFDVDDPLAAELARAPGHAVVVDDQPALGRAIRRAIGAPEVDPKTRALFEFNAPEAAVQAERLSALRQQAQAAVDSLEAERQTIASAPTAETQVTSVFPTPELAGMWDKLMRAGADPIAGAVGSVEPTGLSQVADAVESIDRGMYLDPQTGIGLTADEAAELRSYLLRVLNGTLSTALGRRAGRKTQAFAARVKPPDDFDQAELQDRAKQILDEINAMKRETDDPLDGFEGTQYVPSPPPTRSRAAPESPITPRLLLTDRFAGDIIPGLTEELHVGRMETVGRRVATSRITRSVEALAGPRPEKEIRAQAIRNFKAELSRYMDPDLADSKALKKLDEAVEAAFVKWRDYIETTKVVGYQLYRRIHLMGPEKMDALFREAIDEVYGGNTPGWLLAMEADGKTVNQLWRRADNRLRNSIAQSGLPLSRRLELLYGKTADLGERPGRALVLLYHVARFYTDLRWLALEAVEPMLLTLPQGGLRPVVQAHGLTRAGGPMRRGSPAPPEPMGFGGEVQKAAFADYAHWASLLSDTAQSSAVRQRYLIRELTRQQKRQFRDVLLDMARKEPELVRLIDEMGDTAESFLSRLDRDWQLAELGERKLTTVEAERVFKPWRDAGFIDDAEYAEYVKAGKYTVHPAIEAELKRVVADPVATTLYNRLAFLNHQLFHDLTATFFGQENRSNLQRLINHPLLYWPISYQIKATKWLLRFMLEESFGIDSGAVGGLAIQRVWDEHRRRVANDADYRLRLMDNATLFFVAGMLLPITPFDIGVSMSPWLRMATDENYRRQAGIFGWGPFYTYTSLLPRLIAEQRKQGHLDAELPLVGKVGERLQQAFPQQIVVGRPKPTSTIDAEAQRIYGGTTPPLPVSEPEYPRLP